ncbi:6-hydroxymethylpterin diphosphokinase MptE-like protein [Treponema socranskii]|uniref:6-hydroxymethylpterin diphosphokinase MptE-like protein n=1 Tax=Treponema socranskii TaxID=53419 RepID=UPI0028E20985|nr:6-hydroxymethylpterin diphosphokinase MptE-like protein [Treponema socranskii]
MRGILTENDDGNPRPVQTEGGISVLYKGRYLYSKYAPEKAIKRTVLSKPVAPGTLVLACSPVLCLCLAELCASLPENCFVLGCEFDAVLYAFSLKYIPHDIARFAMLSPDELPKLPFMLTKRRAETKSGAFLPPAGTFRRVLRADFSAGTQFFPQHYAALTEAAENAVMRFWKNRITLIKFGRRFSRNLFRNIARLPRSCPIENLTQSVEKPIIVFGAGESMEKTARSIRSVQSAFYIVAADAALAPLFRFGIEPDAVVCEEAQSVIAPFFLGANGKRFRVFAGITSWPKLFDLSDGTICYFSPHYDDTAFFDSLVVRRILPCIMPPLGSVGLTATKIALMLRKTDRIPVFVTGLDFSYRAGTTHARGSAPHTARLASSFRISPAANYEAAFGCSMQKIIGKDGSPFFTSPALLSYVQTFRAYFSESPNLFDAGTTGIELGIPQKDVNDLIRESGNTVGTERDRRKKDANGAETIVGQKDSENDIARTGTDEKAVHAKKTFTERTAFSERKALSVRNFYEKEECALERLKNILSSGQNMSETERRVEIEKLLAAREYLYLHFPDGLKASFDLSFLKRVRAEIDFFIKDIEVGKSILERD